MNSPEPLGGDKTEEARLFDGDSGELALDARRALVQLLVGPAIDGRRQQKLWSALLTHEAAIRSRLSDLFLTLVIDTEAQVAFTRQVQAEELEVPRLLRKSQLTFIDSVLLLHLRERLARAEAHGERGAVSEAEMLEDLSLYERALSTDHAGFVKRVSAAIEKVKSYSILHKIRGSDSRYEISPTLKILLSVGQLEALKVEYENLAQGTVSQERDGGGETERAP